MNDDFVFLINSWHLHCMWYSGHLVVLVICLHVGYLLLFSERVFAAMTLIPEWGF